MEAKQYKGLWWLPENKSDIVAGILYYEPSKEFRLELIGSFSPSGNDPMFSVFDVKAEAVIHGQAADGDDITLFDCGCNKNHRWKADFATTTYNAKSIAIGIHLSSLDEKKFFKAVAKIPELSFWLYPNIIKRMPADEESGKGICLKIDCLQNDEREVGKTALSKNITLSLCKNANYHSGNFMFQPTFEQYTSIQFESSKDLSFQDLYTKVVKYESFLSIATLRNVGFSELALYSKDIFYTIGKDTTIHHPIIIDTVFHQSPNTNKIDKHQFLFDYDLIKDKHSNIIKRFFANDTKFDAIREHFLDSLEYHRQFSYLNFLIVIQAVEGFGARYMSKEIKAYKDSLPANRTKHALSETVSAMLLYYKDIECINQAVDTEAITQTRNYHSHLFAQRGQKVVDGFDLYKVTDELKKLLVCCILTYLGLTNAEINTITKRTHNILFNPPWSANTK